MRLSFVAAAAAALMFSTAAFAEDAATTQTPNDPDKIVCKSMAPPTGTRIGARRVCNTQRVWDDMQRQSQQAVTAGQMRGLTGGVAGP